MSSHKADIRRILVPHDFSEAAAHALGFALDLAERLGASVTVVHAYDLPVLGSPEGLTITADVVGQLQRTARDALDGVVRSARRPGVEIDAVLRQGAVWSEIQTVAREKKADLIVMGTHGRHGFSRAMLGSVAAKVVRTAPCPVLTVRPESQRALAQEAAASP